MFFVPCQVTVSLDALNRLVPGVSLCTGSGLSKDPRGFYPDCRNPALKTCHEDPLSAMAGAVTVRQVSPQVCSFLGWVTFFKTRGEDSRCGHRVRERVCNWQYCGQTENWESRSWTSSVHSQRSTAAHKLFFNEAPVDRLLARRGSNQRRYDQAAYGE